MKTDKISQRTAIEIIKAMNKYDIYGLKLDYTADIVYNKQVR